MRSYRRQEGDGELISFPSFFRCSSLTSENKNQHSTTDGPLAAEAPATADEIRLISLGRFVADRDTLFPVSEGASTSGGGERGASAETAAPAAPSLRPPKGAALPGPPASPASSAPADEGSSLARHPPPTLHVVIRRKGESKGGGGTGGKGGGKGGSGRGEGGGGSEGGNFCSCCSCSVQ